MDGALEDILRHVPLFAELSAADAAELVKTSRRFTARPGDMILEEGSEGDALFVILSGELEVIKRDGGRDLVLASRKPGEYIGEMSLLDRTPRTASARALRDSEILEIGAATFYALLEQKPRIATSILRTVAGRLRSTEGLLVQREKLASLGTLAAGLAHELNNPAAAIQRSVAYLDETLEAWGRRFAGAQPDAELERAVYDAGMPTHDAAAHESRIADKLEALGVDDPWEIAPALAAYGWTVERMEPYPGAALAWLGAGLTAKQLIAEVQRSAQAVSEIVRSVKSYSYLDQAPVQQVDLVASLEDTLMILKHKLKQGIDVIRDFEPALPRIEASGGELNQVWTNIIDNAVQAMDRAGTLEVRARRLGDNVEVRIADSGPGIPPEVRPKLFEPFFTTKAQGIGTGLGLHIAHNIIVNRHGGRIDVESRPGRTEFRVTLPMRLPPGTKR